LLATIMTGSLMAAPFLVPVRPLVIVGFSTLAACVLWKAEIREPLIPRQNWGGIAQLVGRGFPPDAVLWAPKKYAKLMRPYLPDREVTDGPIDDGAFAGGRWLVFDAAFKGGPERARFTWESLPEGVRYVSTPLLINYQRLFFVPPANRGIVRIDQEGRDIPFPAAGRQPRDPALLADSAGDGDALYPPGAEGEFARFEPALSVPGELTVMLQDGAPAGSCNLLFSQILADKRVRAGVQGPDGVWRQVAPFVLGELVSVPLAKENSRAVRLHLTPNPDYRPGPRLSGERPALGLVDAWVTRGTPR
jgi:hypothetical protein